ncbi:hypothetical protein Ctob_000360, partial [Chrysochromulina tobinii]
MLIVHRQHCCSVLSVLCRISKLIKLSVLKLTKLSKLIVPSRLSMLIMLRLSMLIMLSILFMPSGLSILIVLRGSRRRAALRRVVRETDHRHRRELQTAVSTTTGLTSALANTAAGRIVLASGTYNLSAELSITRSVILEAAAGATVILNAQASSSSPRRVLYINPGPSGIVQLIGLNITGGYIDFGGGVFVGGGTVSIVNSQIYSNTAPN